MTIHISHNNPLAARKGWQRDALLSLYFGLGALGIAKVSNFAETIHVQYLSYNIHIDAKLK